MDYIYAVYKKHRAARAWTRVGSYRVKHIAEMEAREIRDSSKYMQTRVAKVKSLMHPIK